MNEPTWDDFRFEKPTSKMISLPTEPMERIFHYLDARDKCEACLVHPNWSVVAMGSLWKAPRFRRPEPLRTFLKTTSSVKKVALLVRDFHLAFLDDQEDSVFQPLARSCLERHQQKNTLPLAKPNLIYDLARYCENMTDLVCYGWHMKPGDWDRTLGVAHKLSSLSVIGCPQPISIHTLIKLTKFHLDGSFGINEVWMNSFVNKAIYLKDLKLSLENVTFRTFTILCTPGCLQLESLALTRAMRLTDDNIPSIARAFPDLKTLILEGCIEITPKTIYTALNLWPKLEHLEIRSNSQSTSRPTKMEIQSSESSFKLRKLLLEHQQVTDDIFRCLGPLLPHLQTLGLKDCIHLTSQGIRDINAYNCIKTLHMIQCPLIDSVLFSSIAATPISNIYIQSCGHIAPINLFRFCSESICLNLVQIVGYNKLKESIIDKYHPNIPSVNAKLVLNQSHIQSIAKTYETDLNPPKERFLSSRQIVLLAKLLNMVPKDLNDLMDLSEQEELRAIYNELEPAPTQVPLKNCWSQTGSFSQGSARPDTPTVWKNDYRNYGAIPSGQDYNSVVDTKAELSEYSRPPTSKDTQRDFEESYSDSRKNSLEFLLSNSQKRRGTSQQTFQVVENDNWEQSNHILEWDSYHTGDYCHEPLQEQKTTYFDNREKKANFSCIDSFESIQSDEASLSTHENISQPSTNTIYRPFPLVSDDEGPDWDDSDSEQILVKAYASTVDPKAETYSSFSGQKNFTKKRTGRNAYTPSRPSSSSRERFSSEKKEKESYGATEDQYANSAKANYERKRYRATRQKRIHASYREEQRKSDRYDSGKAEDFGLTETPTFSRLSAPDVSETAPLVDLKGGETILSTYPLNPEIFSELLTPEPVALPPTSEIDTQVTKPAFVDSLDSVRPQSASSSSTDSMEWRDKTYEVTPEEVDYLDIGGSSESPESNGGNLFFSMQIQETPRTKSSFEIIEEDREIGTLTNLFQDTVSTANEISFESLVKEVPYEDDHNYQFFQNTKSSNVSIPSSSALTSSLKKRSPKSPATLTLPIPSTSEDISFEPLVQEMSSSVESQHIPPIMLPATKKPNPLAVEGSEEPTHLPLEATHSTDTLSPISNQLLQSSTKKMRKKKIKPGLLCSRTIKVSENQFEKIFLTMDEPCKETVQKFCAKHNIPHIEKELLNYLEPIYTTKKTTHIFDIASQNQKKKKNVA